MKPVASVIKPNKRAAVISVIYAGAFAFAMFIGAGAARYGALTVNDPVLWVTGIISFAIALIVVYAFLTHTSGTIIDEKPQSESISLSRPGLIRDWLIIFACWLPVFLAEYPGFFVYDAVDEYTSVATRQFTTHHPLMHTLLLGGSVRAGEVFFGDANVGIAAFILVQMILLSFVFAWVISQIGRRGYRVFAMVWYGLFPTVVMFALCSVKDTLCAAAILLSVVLTVRVLSSRHIPIADLICLAISLLVMMLMRHNAVYAYIIYACAAGSYLAAVTAGPVLRRITPAVCMAGLLCVYLIISSALAYAFGADDSEHQEILTVPIQQLARTWSVYSDEMSPEELETLYEILPETTLTHYTPELSDPVKIGFNNAVYEQDPDRYRRLWIELFIRHPLSYINAWLDTSYGYYYPYAIVNVYEGHQTFTYTYTESSYFGYEVEYPGVRHSLIPFIDRFYRWLSLDDDIQRIPVIARLFSMGALFWVYAFGMAVFVYRRDHMCLIAYLLPLSIWATLLLGPTFLPRYTVFWWFILPYLIYGITTHSTER
ncbi:MAG: hypothetical protein IJS12_11080 [Lachnospiraceae bacterium]|nr:hypothetical protein [Lachnospiraceae bacterium]